jgi:beta-lactamase superfamily II metal-dependent hydrolase
MAITTRPLALASAALLLCVCMAGAQVPGQTLPHWSPGYLDIHHINTGKGDSTLFVFPDGTTLLVDAGASLRPGPRITAQRPDSSRAPGEWIARYVQWAIQPLEAKHLDYALLTHFDGDHMGDFSAELKDSRLGPYKLAGITEVGEHIPIRRLIDRAWPDYDYPGPLDSPRMNNYRKFLAWQMENRGMRPERFQPGRNDRIALNQPARYPHFEIRNIAANGEIWTGLAANTRQHFPPLDSLAKPEWPSENMCSIAFRLSYGKFDYFTGGDIPGLPPDGSPAWHDVESAVAPVVGPVEVHVLNHHGFHDSANALFLGALRPLVHIMHVYAPSHPGHRVLSRLLSTRIYPGPRDIFATNIMDATRIVIGDAIDRMKSRQGHILVRVAPPGDSFHVIILDDSEESFKVTAVHGPYMSR